MRAEDAPIQAEQGESTPNRHHKVDGISFRVTPSEIVGVGWQGRHLQFHPNNMDAIIQLMGQIRQGYIEGDTNYSLNIKTQGEKGEELDFNVIQNGSWINVIDKPSETYIAMATDDKEAISHVLEELKPLRDDDNIFAYHFCEKFGVEDND